MAEGAEPELLADLARHMSELTVDIAQYGTSAEQVLRAAQAELTAITEGSSESPEDSLTAMAVLMGDLQTAIETWDGTVPTSDNPDGGEFTLPEWVDESIFLEFIAGHTLVLDEIEAEILGLDGGRTDTLRSLKAHLHTLKGESGILGLEDIERICHKAEDFLDVPNVESTLRVDTLLAVKDWIDRALDCYADGTMPQQAVGEMIALLAKSSEIQTPATDDSAQTLEATSGSQPQPADEVGDEPNEPDEHDEPDEPDLKSVTSAADWDEDELELVGEFLEESMDGLAKVDEILLTVESESADNEKINALFRVFHSMKGVAGFLELEQITKLAHVTETLLNRVREGTVPFEGAVLDLTFDSTEQMRELMDDLRHSAENGGAIGDSAGCRLLIGKIEKALQGNAVEDPLPPVAVGAKLGEILESNGLAKAEDIAAALESQKATGRKLGEELVQQEGVKPKDVARALRVQKRSKLKETVKVDLERVDALVEMIGELVIVESMVVHAPEIDTLSSPRIRTYLSQLAKITRDLQDIGMRMRMVPVRGVFQKMARMVRDLSRREGKEIRAVLKGEWTEMDRSMVEQIADPLVHMIRNAVDHGLEDVAQRKASGKSPVGTVTLSAYHQGGSIVIEIGDDGRGLNRDAILKKANERGILKPGEILADGEIYNLIFAPGFSTAQKVTEISGRGVGMDVVRRNIEAMRGRVTITSVPGAGSTFKMILPLTLAIIDGMIVSCGQERYIIPTLSIIESVRPDADMLYAYVGRGALIDIRNERVPLLRLDRLFGIPDAEQDATKAQVVIVETTDRKLGLIVDDVVAQQQVVIKTLGTNVPGTNFLSGAAILSDGKVGLILNVDELRQMIDSDMSLNFGSTGDTIPVEARHAAATGLH